MWHIIGGIVLGLVGFFIGKQFQQSRTNESSKSATVENGSDKKHDVIVDARRVPQHDGFDLSKLRNLYANASVDMNEYDSFRHLLGSLKTESYFNVLRAVDNNSATVKNLVEIVENATYQIEANDNIALGEALGGPYISKEEIYKICNDEGISTIGDIDNVVVSLILLKINDGMKLFGDSFGYRFNNLVKRFRAGEDVEKDFMKIKHQFQRELDSRQ